MSSRPRALVVGGGIAGVSAAHHLASTADVTLVEREHSLAYHTTGRSAALYFENYGAIPNRPLTRASRRFFADPPAGLADQPLLRPRGALTIAGEDQLDRLRTEYEQGLASGTRLDWLDTAGVQEHCPVVRPEAAVAGIWEPEASDMDVAAIHQAFVRGLRRSGGTIQTGCEVLAGSHGGDGWCVALSEGAWEGDLLVNAAGAWGDVVAERCGVGLVGLQPKRRTAFMVAAPPDAASWPLVVDADQSFYFKPDGPQLLCSLADETPSPPCDARPEEIDVALAIERINTATRLGLRSVRSQWAGLRTFVPDKALVIGPDPAVPHFTWLVGQGGTGIQTAPAAGQLAASLALEAELPEALVAAGVDVEALGPERLRGR